MHTVNSYFFEKEFFFLFSYLCVKKIYLKINFLSKHKYLQNVDSILDMIYSTTQKEIKIASENNLKLNKLIGA